MGYLASSIRGVEEVLASIWDWCQHSTARNFGGDSFVVIIKSRKPKSTGGSTLWPHITPEFAGWRSSVSAESEHEAITAGIISLIDYLRVFRKKVTTSQEHFWEIRIHLWNCREMICNYRCSSTPYVTLEIFEMYNVIIRAHSFIIICKVIHEINKRNLFANLLWRIH